MAVIPKVYIDNNDKIYYSDRSQFSNLQSGSNQLTASLDDVAKIPGQSTWIVNKITFGANLYFDFDGVNFDGMAYGSALLGIIPNDDVGTYDTLEDYQDVRGWPLLGTSKMWSISKMVDAVGDLIPNLYPLSRTSLSGTYTPKSALALNRMQKIVFNLDNVTTLDVYGTMWIFISARRGE